MVVTDTNHQGNSEQQQTYMGADNAGTVSKNTTNDGFIKPHKHQGPEALVPYMKYEQIIKKQKASQDFQADQPRLIKTEVRQSLALSWEAAAGNNYSFKVTDNKGNVLFSQDVQNSHIMLQGFTNKGLYYWKLADDKGKLAYIGKIRVE